MQKQWQSTKSATMKYNVVRFDMYITNFKRTTEMNDNTSCL